MIKTYETESRKKVLGNNYSLFFLLYKNLSAGLRHIKVLNYIAYFMIAHSVI